MNHNTEPDILPNPEDNIELEDSGEYKEVDASKMVESEGGSSGGGATSDPAATAGAGVIAASDISDAQGTISGVSDDDSPARAAFGGPQDDVPSSDLTADDVDLIEKEWVDKAKSVVSATLGNPRAQSRELSKIKAEYMYQRYGKKMMMED